MMTEWKENRATRKKQMEKYSDPLAVNGSWDCWQLQRRRRNTSIKIHNKDACGKKPRERIEKMAFKMRQSLFCYRFITNGIDFFGLFVLFCFACTHTHTHTTETTVRLQMKRWNSPAYSISLWKFSFFFVALEKPFICVFFFECRISNEKLI